MRRRSVLLAVPALMLTAAGCGSGDSSGDAASSPSDSPSDTASPTGTPSASATPTAKIVSGPVPAVTGGTSFDKKPTVAKGSGTPSKDLAVKTVIQGDGPAIASGDFVQVNYLGQVWDTAKVFDTSFGRGPYTNVIGQGKVIPGWDQGLLGQKVRSRVELAIPPALGYGSSGNAQAGIKGTDTLVFVVDVLERFNAKSSATGKAAAQNDASLPKVGANTDGKAPVITVPKGAKAPTKLVAEYVLEGDGAVVKATDNLLLQYKGVLWDTGKEFDSTYAHGQLAAFPLAQLIKGWQQGLAGKKVGSRVMLVTPPGLAYGNQANNGIPANSTLVFTLDILALL
ncbi:FKBP-type peptidyl-prolyl cis-trans isomerase [Actinacidiphila sp. ITFR-21]|uniref:FKBP-type peptidyl-prolyl cis-trans isomerase n=1 Tax=Actinacidiphila sp. ITFR-21 TaxID=3075199 RepID=UPI00288C611F|nr:FKBP-type peptidyl-prolyl cis-trans isomerase [Streptomyces sp. ITFR-21]WNI14787.1 FKBP-type peptidyl-prolyl cis-trans isomerase [Streptomyces sp. ITFR-21]